MNLDAHLDTILRRHDEIGDRLGAGASGVEFSDLSREYAELEPLAASIRGLRAKEKERADLEAMLADPALESDMREIAASEIDEAHAAIETMTQDIRLALLPKDAADESNVILEVRAGTGGDEAALFAGDLFRMYVKYAEARGWTVDVLSLSEGTAGGYKEIIAEIAGRGAFARLKYESGVHRVQRVPANETQGRIHTSTATVAVLPEADEVEVHVEEKDLEISIAASGGPGGQGVNTTNSAVQILHKPSGIIVKCQDERSQLKNKAKALKVLRARLLEAERERQDKAEAATRKSMVSTGERSQKIRTYNYPQNRVTDHRIRMTLNKLDRVMEGDLDELVTALRTSYQAERLQDAGVAMSRRAPAPDGDAADAEP